MDVVVKLPTAAPRKVNNNRYSAQRDAAQAAREGSKLPEAWLPSWKREQLLREKATSSVPRSPELALLFCLLDTLPVEQLMKMAKTADTMRERPANNEAAAFAHAILTELAESKRKGLWP